MSPCTDGMPRSTTPPYNCPNIPNTESATSTNQQFANAVNVYNNSSGTAADLVALNTAIAPSQIFVQDPNAPTVMGIPAWLRRGSVFCGQINGKDIYVAKGVPCPSMINMHITMFETPTTISNPIPHPTPTMPPNQIPTSEPFTVIPSTDGNGVVITHTLSGNTEQLISSGGQIMSSGVIPKQD